MHSGRRSSFVQSDDVQLKIRTHARVLVGRHCLLSGKRPYLGNVPYDKMATEKFTEE
jgi:hypothetical protein